MATQNWQFLNPGDIVDVIAPGSAVKGDVVKKAAKFLRAIGLRPRIPAGLMGRHPYLANRDSQRWLHLKRALHAKDSKLIWCLRGGYGCGRLMPQLLKLSKPKRAKLLLGYSDITVLHNHLNGKWHWPSIHGPLLDRFASGRASKADILEIRRVLFGQSKEVSFRGLRPLNKAARRKRTIRAPIVGGNLVLAQTSLGTDWQLKTKGRILFFEDIGERGYRLDRTLHHLAQAGYFKGVRAIVLGDFVGGEEPNGRNHVGFALREFADSVNIPVLRGLPCGHGRKQRPLPFNTVARLETGKRGQLVVSTGGK